MDLSTRVLAACGSMLAAAYVLAAQGTMPAPPSIDHPAIQYISKPTSDAVAKLNTRIQAGQATLAFDGRLGYLQSVLSALGVPVDSQMLVYSPTSSQTDHITEKTPRAVYFNDTTAVGWVNGGDVLEVAALDPEQGEIFWTLTQQPQERPQFVRSRQCLECHYSYATSGVPGLLVMSMLPLSDNQSEYAQGWPVDHRTPIADRWGGWYVTGAQVPSRHLGNVQVYHAPRSYVREPVAPVLSTARDKIESGTYLTPYSDVVALLVLNHQALMTDLLTSLGWQARMASSNTDPRQSAAAAVRLRAAARDVADYMLFADEAELTGGVKGSSGFAESFSSRGPRDSRGRSLRDLDLEHRLMRYPCSYMIYAPVFDALPANAREIVYAELWSVLSGQSTDPRFARLSAADRTAIVEILRETKSELPSYFGESKK